MFTVIAASLSVLFGLIGGFFIGMWVAFSTHTSAIPTQSSTEYVKSGSMPKKKEEHFPIIKAEAILPKRIKEDEYNKRVNAVLLAACNRVVDVFLCGMDRKDKDVYSNLLYTEWHSKLHQLAYCKYDPDLQKLTIIGRAAKSGFKFYAVWCRKDGFPDMTSVGWDCVKEASDDGRTEEA